MGNRASRVTIKGSEDLGGNLKANFFLEWGISPDENVDGQNGGGDGGFSRRNQWVGLSGSSWGEVRFGRHDTPLKFSQGKYDVFNDQFGDIAGITLGENRVDNVLAYVSPNFSGFGFAIAGIPGEGEEATGGLANNDRDGFADYFSAAATYGNGPFFVSVGYDYFDPDDDLLPFDPDGGFPPILSGNETLELQDDRIRVIGTYSSGAFQVGALYETTDFANDGTVGSTESYDVWGVSGKYTFGNNAIKAQYHGGTREREGGANDEDSDLWSVGLDHMFSKRTRVYAEYTDGSEENDIAGLNTDDDEFTFAGVGIEHKF
jgi:predicted porin